MQLILKNSIDLSVAHEAIVSKSRFGAHMLYSGMKIFGRHFPYLTALELIEYFGVFEGFGDLHLLHDQPSLMRNIEVNILQKYHEHKERFILSNEAHTQENIEKLLYRISVGNRKIYSIYKSDISHFQGASLYQILFQKEIIAKEYSREKPLRTDPSRQIKKALRGYQIEDKIIFTKGFYRFWFTFIAPNRALLEAGDHESVLKLIQEQLDKYLSLTFEALCSDLIAHTFAHESITESGSYWDKKIELDLLARTSSGLLIAGEAKWKNQKISKNILNKLQKKCASIGLKPDYLALFSKSGYSRELQNSKDKQILLYDVNSFKGWLDAGK